MDDELDLARLAPLHPEQIFHLTRAIHRPELGAEPDEEERWAWIALHVNANCPELPVVDIATLRAVVGRSAGAFSSPFHKYSLWAQVFPDDWITFMNYGYRPLDGTRLALVGAEATWESAVALYHRVGSQVALAGKDVLEVGCGRGGGAAYLARAHAPRSLLASDGARSHVRFCHRVHSDAGGRLRFVHALAEDLPGDAGGYDVVISIESCNYYEPFSAFAVGAARLLRPGGHLLLAAYHGLGRAVAMDRALAVAGFTLERREDISAGVQAALAHFRNHQLLACIEQNPTVRARRHYHDWLAGAYANDALADDRERYYCAAWRLDRR